MLFDILLLSCNSPTEGGKRQVVCDDAKLTISGGLDVRHGKVSSTSSSDENKSQSELVSNVMSDIMMKVG